MRTTEVGTKPEPVTDTVVALPPAVAEVGETDVLVGVGFLTVNGNALEAPPFGAGFTTAMLSVPALATSEARMVVWSDVESPNDVEWLMPFTVTMETDVKFVPFTVSGKAALPAKTPEGNSEVICGTGLGAGSIVNVACGRAVPPPGCGVVTVTSAVPAFWMRLAGICAVNSVVLTNNVLSAPLFQVTAEDGVKFPPKTCNMNAGFPACMSAGTKGVFAFSLGAG
jgi:hypothetical protein